MPLIAVGNQIITALKNPNARMGMANKGVAISLSRVIRHHIRPVV
jgi:hypothetical protein